MVETIPQISVGARFEGGHLVPNEPLDMPEGTRLLVTLRGETAEEKKARQLKALKRASGIIKGGPTVDPKYVDDRDFIYDDLHRAGLE